MIDLTYDPTTGVAKAVSPIAFKGGGDVRVRVTMAPPPGEVTDLTLAVIGTDANAAILAFTDVFVAESDRVWLALLDANDTRLIAALAGKASLTVAIEFSATIDGAALTSPNVAATAQRKSAGTAATEGGPTYYTAAEVDAAIAAALAAVSPVVTDTADGHTYRWGSTNGVPGFERVS